MTIGKFLSGSLVGTLLMGLAPGAQAADFTARTELAERSSKEGVGLDQVPLLKRITLAGRERVIERLAPLLRKSADDEVFVDPQGKGEIDRDSITLTGEGWRLEVEADGSRVRYRNDAYLDAGIERAVPVSKRPPQEDLAKRAEAFIAQRLRGFVTLGPREKLVPLFTEYQVGGGGSTKEGARPDAEYVAAATVVFGRTINDIHVLGPGSKVAVVFSVDGRVAGFDYDWPTYEVTSLPGKVTPLEQVKERANRLAAFDLDKRRGEVQRVECGYFDLGIRRRDAAAPVQTACAIHAVTRTIIDAKAHAEDRNSGHIVSAKIHVVPAGETVYPDRKWPLAQRLLGLPETDPDFPGTGPGQQGTATTAAPIGAAPL